MAQRKDDPNSYIEGCSQYTSEIGSYSCSSNEDRTQKCCRRGVTKLSYPSTLLVMRHSERMDEVFPKWTEKANHNGQYRTYDVNMPPKLPFSRPLQHYENDTPLTVTGDILARLVGRGIAMSGYCPDVIYCSPATRCIQTATAVRAMCKSKALLRVEPGLFENASLYPEGAPVLSTASERKAFPVDPEYRPFLPFQNIFGETPENNEDYNRRVRSTFQRIAKNTEVSEKNDIVVLIVAHASTVDMAVGLLRPRPRPTTQKDLHQIGHRVPFCSIVAMEREQGERGWTPNPYAFSPVTYQDFSTAYDPKFVNRP